MYLFSIWAIEVASQLSSSQVTAFDIANTHFPNPEFWPSNAKFDLLDSLHDIPLDLVGQFDVVHLRMWAFVVRGDDPSPLIQNAAKMLSKHPMTGNIWSGLKLWHS